MALTDQVLMPGSDYQAICDATRSLTGTTGTLKSGEVASKILEGKKVTYLLKKTLVFPDVSTTYTLNFINNTGSLYTSIYMDTSDSISKKVYYKTSTASDYIYNSNNGWSDDGINTNSEKWNRIITVLGDVEDSNAQDWLDDNVDMVLESGEVSLSNVTASAINVDDTTGKISCSFNVSKGVTSSVTVNPTKQLPTQAGKTITPSSSTQVAARGAMYLTEPCYVAPVPLETKTVTLSMTSGNQTVSSSSGKYMNNITINKPSTLIPSNIKLGTSIAGVTGTAITGNYEKITTARTTTGTITFSFSDEYRFLAVVSATNYVMFGVIFPRGSAYVGYAQQDTSENFTPNPVGVGAIACTYSSSRYNCTWILSQTSGNTFYSGTFSIYGLK